MNAANRSDDSIISRRASGRHRQVSGYVSEDLAKSVKIEIAKREINQSVALEEALAQWVESQQQPATPG